MKKHVIFSVFIIVGAVVFWFFYALRSYAVMAVYSGQHSKDSVMHKNGFSIEMPSEQGWYPFVMTYNAPGFSNWADVDANMSIMYNFGAFDAKTRTSSIYDPQSERYSSFYGAYVVQKSEDDFGFFDNGELDMQEVALAVEYDYTQLVIKDFGCDNQTFAINQYTITQDVECAGSDGWTRIDAELTANGAAHNFEEHKTPYLQYGRPMQTVEQDFPLVTLQGRVFAKYFEEYDCTVMMYVIAPSVETIERCNQTVLEKTKILDI